MKFTDAVKKLNESFGFDGKSYEERKSKEVKGLNEKPKSVKKESSTKKLDDDEKMIRLIEKVLESPPEEFVISPFSSLKILRTRENTIPRYWKIMVMTFKNVWMQLTSQSFIQEANSGIQSCWNHF